MESVVFGRHLLYIRPYSSSCKDDLCTSLFLAAPTPNFKLSVPQSWHSRGEPENPEFLTLTHLCSVYLIEALRFVCCSRFAITRRNIQLFVNTSTAERQIEHSQHKQSGCFWTIIFWVLIHEATGSNDGKAHKGMLDWMEERKKNKLSLWRQI